MPRKARGGGGGGGLLTDQVVTGIISLILTFALAAVLVVAFTGVGQQISNSLPAPTQGSLFYNMTTTFEKAVSSGLSLVNPAIIVAVAFFVIIVLVAIFRASRM